MIGENYFYRQPFNSSIDDDYQYIYQYEDISHIQPDGVVFCIFALLIINTVAALPISLFILITVFKDQKLRTNKFVFVSMICACDLMTLTSNIVNLSAIRNGLVLKTTCSTVGMLRASSGFVRAWTISSIGILAVLIIITAHREDTKRIQNIYTKSKVVSIIVMTLFYAISGRSGAAGEHLYFAWDPNKFTCAIEPHSISSLIAGFGALNTFMKIFFIIIIPLGFLIVTLPVPLAIYFTYRKCRFYGCRKFRIAPEVSQSGVASSTRMNSNRSSAGKGKQSNTSSTERIFRREEKEEIDTIVTLYLQFALWLPWILVTASQSIPVESLVYHFISVLNLMNPCVFIAFNPPLKEQFLHHIRQFYYGFINPREGVLSIDEEQVENQIALKPIEAETKPVPNVMPLAMMKDISPLYKSASMSIPPVTPLSMMKDMTRLSNYNSRKAERDQRLSRGEVGITTPARKSRGNSEMIRMA